MNKQQITWMIAILVLVAGVVEFSAGVRFMSDNLNVTLTINEISLYYASVAAAVLIGVLAAFKITGSYWRALWVSLSFGIILAHFLWVTAEGVDGITWFIGFSAFTAVSFILLAFQVASIAYSKFRSLSSANN